MLLLLCIILFSFFGYTLLMLPALRENPLIESTFAIIILYSFYNIIRKGQSPFTLSKIFNIFSMFFFGIAPWLQFRDNITLWGAPRFHDFSYLALNLIIISLLFVFNISYKYTKTSTSNIKVEFPTNDSYTISSKRTYLLIAISATVFIYIFYRNNFNPFLMFFRGFTGIEKVQGIRSISLIINSFIRPIPMAIFMVYMFCNNRRVFVAATLLLLAILTTAPTAVARLSAAAMYIPIALLLSPTLRKGDNFVAMMVAGLMVVFPFLNNFRRFSLDRELALGVDFSMFYEGHFDAYNNFLLVVENNYITYGRQLMGAILFFIPRSIWPNKPVGSGHMIVDDLSLIFNNISMPFLAEGYINFGYIGSLVFTILLAIFCKKMDNKYWIEGNQSVTLKVQYLILIGMLFFCLRGDMMSGTAYTTGRMVSVLFVGMLAGIRKKITSI